MCLELKRGGTPMKYYFEFWRSLLMNPIRVICIVIILLCQTDLVGVCVSVVIMLGVTWFLLSRGIIAPNWREKTTQTIATAISMVLAIGWIFKRLNLLNAVFINLVAIIMASVIGGIALIFLFFNKK